MLKKRKGNSSTKVQAKCWRCKVQFQSDWLKEKKTFLKNVKNLDEVEVMENGDKMEEMIIVELSAANEKEPKAKWPKDRELREVEERLIEEEIFEEED